MDTNYTKNSGSIRAHRLSNSSQIYQAHLGPNVTAKNQGHRKLGALLNDLTLLLNCSYCAIEDKSPRNSHLSRIEQKHYSIRPAVSFTTKRLTFKLAEQWPAPVSASYRVAVSRSVIRSIVMRERRLCQRYIEQVAALATAELFA